jgi:hypothetical protein
MAKKSYEDDSEPEVCVREIVCMSARRGEGVLCMSASVCMCILCLNETPFEQDVRKELQFGEPDDESDESSDEKPKKRRRLRKGSPRAKTSKKYNLRSLVHVSYHARFV